MVMRHVSVIGATGGIGAHVTRMAAEAGHAVIAAARQPERLPDHPRITRVRCDVTDPATVRSAVAGADVILSCLGNDRGRTQVTCEGTCNILDAVAHASRVVAISSVGIGDSYEQSLRMSWFFTRLIAPTILRRPFADLGRMENAMTRHPQTTVIVRPVGLTNGPPTGQATGMDVDSDVGMQVSRADVAQFMVGLIDDDQWDNRAVTVGTPLSPR